jgi:hypothetical protein
VALKANAVDGTLVKQTTAAPDKRFIEVARAAETFQKVYRRSSRHRNR